MSAVMLGLLCAMGCTDKHRDPKPLILPSDRWTAAMTLFHRKMCVLQDALYAGLHPPEEQTDENLSNRLARKNFSGTNCVFDRTAVRIQDGLNSNARLQ
ncbi:MULTISPECIES: hypothetical protein [Xanthomonas]|nr:MULTISPECIES: hypothetical protein [Xanthomonas]MBB4729483.1 hypothetical protein [Xanthomonas arboricola]PPT57580.1 hypothetical protein XarbCFBP8153_16215 [Xanthomonas arboricola]QDS16072.1 hypothetical protein FPL04_10800 [Xanthomonas arboricola]